MDKKQALKCEFFKEMTVGEAAIILEKLELVSLHKGESLFSQGEDGRSLFILLSGKLSAYVAVEGNKQHLVGEIFSGETVGEMSLLTNETRSATVKAIRRSNLLKLSLEQFNLLWKGNPHILLTIAKRTALRLGQTLAKMSSRDKKRRVLLVPENENIPIAAFIDKINVKIRNNPKVNIVSLNSIQHTIKDIKGFDHVTRFLDDQDQNTNTVIYVGDIANKEWMEICLELSDKVIIVADGDKPPQYHPRIEEVLDESSQHDLTQTELILLHKDPNKFPQKTERWLNRQWYRNHFHIVMDKPQDLDRIYRFLVGTPISFVFAGGGARSFAQIGALKAIAEAGIPIDAAGGTSQGSISAWLACSGKTHEGIYKTAISALSLMRKGLKQYTWPLFALLSGKSITDGLKQGTEETKIEDLWKTMFCISVDIEHKKEVIHRQGHAWRAIRASISLPAILTPLIMDKSLYVDGGVMNNCPVDVMQEDVLHNEGYVIAFAFTESTEEKLYAGSEDISMLRYFLNKINFVDYKLSLPSIGEILTRSLMASAHKKSIENIKRADTCIRLPINEFSLLDYSDKTVNKLIKIGYDATKKQIQTDPVLQNIIAELSVDKNRDKAA